MIENIDMLMTEADLLDKQNLLLAKQLGQQCQLIGYKIASAESCTGGGLGWYMTSVPGSSKWYQGGIIAYSNYIKNKLLKIPENILEKFGAVSSEVAKLMAQEARCVTNSNLAIAVTGVMGPHLDDYNNPVGTVWIAFESDTDSNAYFLNLDSRLSRRVLQKQVVFLCLHHLCNHFDKFSLS